MLFSSPPMPAPGQLLLCPVSLSLPGTFTQQDLYLQGGSAFLGSPPELLPMWGPWHRDLLQPGPVSSRRLSAPGQPHGPLCSQTVIPALFTQHRARHKINQIPGESTGVKYTPLPAPTKAKPAGANGPVWQSWPSSPVPVGQRWGRPPEPGEVHDHVPAAISPPRSSRSTGTSAHAPARPGRPPWRRARAGRAWAARWARCPPATPR